MRKLTRTYGKRKINQEKKTILTIHTKNVRKSKQKKSRHAFSRKKRTQQLTHFVRFTLEFDYQHIKRKIFALPRSQPELILNKIKLKKKYINKTKKHQIFIYL